ncbi:hypothetical protein EVAR_45949_1 [Eumeta japonica]|uniref:Uncharacterized protein n=1 Tax=Eumeta variegata TaxID=151549 RepID=A0A4C1W7P4_EUMVA|nr:hypothetical protein EVAR_45949_1 [Eumeta japonica]
MPRVRVRKTSRGQSNLSRYKDAYEEVEAGDSLRKAGDKRAINHCFLLRYSRKRHASSHCIQQQIRRKAPVTLAQCGSRAPNDRCYCCENIIRDRRLDLSSLVSWSSVPSGSEPTFSIIKPKAPFETQ